MRFLFSTVSLLAVIAGGVAVTGPVSAAAAPETATDGTAVSVVTESFTAQTRDSVPAAAHDMHVDPAIATALAASVGEAAQRVGSDVGPALDAFYAARNHAPIWAHRPEAAAAMVALLRDAALHGLSPAHYGGAVLETAIQAFAPGTMADAAAIGRADVMLTASALEFADHVSRGRVDPATLGEDFDYDRRPFDAGAMLETLATAVDPVGALLEAAPQAAQYEATRALSPYLQVEIAKGGWPTVPQPETRLVRAGDRTAIVPALRTRLIATGDYSPAAPQPTSVVQGGVAAEPANADTPVYDARLVDAVERFQARHGLTVDGIIGPSTLAALNTSAEERLDQVTASLERWRWLPHDLGSERHIVINVPDFSLDLFEGGTLVRSMRVIVGHPERATPLFSSALTWLEFNPTWTVPHTIAYKDKLPKLINNGNYLAENGYRLYSSWREDAVEITDHFVHWESVGRGIRGMRLVQNPGPGNALGRVKFMMANGFSIYLHDTPDRHLFRRDRRAFSSGCIRVEDPMWLADHLLRHHPNWDGHETDAVLQGWRTTRRTLPDRMPLHITYRTGWRDADGTVQFRPDLYGVDSQVIAALTRQADARDQIALAQ